MQVLSEKDIQKVKDLLVPQCKVVITSHHNPDGDAIGSVLGLYFALKEYGIESQMVLPNDVPDFLSWLPDSEKVIRASKQKAWAKKLIEDADILFALDFNGFSRLEDLSKSFSSAKGIKVLIDHHPFPENTFDIYFSHINSSSTAELIYEFAHALKPNTLINYNAALSIYTGIMTDTGSFSYGCSNPRTFEIVSQLIKKGVKVEMAQQNVYNNFSESRMRLLGHSLANKMKVFPQHKSAYISLTREELKSFGYTIGDTEGLVNYPLSIKNIVFSALFVENANHVKVSLRSKGSFPANKVSEEYYNGGGHLNAAGGKSFKSLQETENLFVEIIEKLKIDLNK
jgi:bifunctional oligoribonuclease and PAP phosphatase NrnA